MKKLYFGLLMTASLLVSCEISDQTQKDPNEGQKVESFNFTTQHNVELSADFGPMAINGLVQVFTSDPTRYVKENDKIVDSYVEGEAIYNTYANQDGRAIGMFAMPDYVNKVWVSLHAMGVGCTLECPVENGQIRIDLATARKAPLRLQSASQAVEPQVFTLPSERLSAPSGWTNFRTLVKWWNDAEVNTYGKIINDPSHLISWDGAAYTDRTPIDYSDLQLLLKALWKGGSSKPSGLDNSSLCVKDVSLVNTTIHAKGESTSTKLWFRFLDEHAWNQNVMGYYYYPEGTEATLNKATMKKYIILPNASKPNHYPYCKPTSGAPYETEYAPAQSGMSIQLLFEDPVTGEVSEEFPAGYTIGFFCLSDAYKNNTSSISATTNNAMFSNDALNANNRSRFICLSMQSNGKDYLVYGMEDGTSDKSYEDILFIIDAENPDMIQEPNRANIRNVMGTASTTVEEHNYFTYAYEDNYEDKRDYDLNDVIVEHHRLYESKKTAALEKQLTTIIDYFTVASLYASFDNAFAFQYAQQYSELGANITIKYEASKNGADWTTWTPKDRYKWVNKQGDALRTYVLYDHQSLSGVKYFRVTRTFNGTVSADDVRAAETSIRPFIIPKWDEKGSSHQWDEIHLPGGEITPYAVNTINGDEDFHFVDATAEPGMLFPYAISLSQTKTERFEPSHESVRIDKTYPRYRDWVKSQGQQATDWYKK